MFGKLFNNKAFLCAGVGANAVACLIATACFVEPARAAPTSNSQDKAADAVAPNPLLVELNLDGAPLVDVLNIYEVRDDVLLPIGQLANSLTLGITVNFETKSVSGYITNEKDNFAIDPTRNLIISGNQRITYAPWQVQWIDGELFVARDLLRKSWPVGFDLDLSTLKLTAKPRVKLPIQLRKEREAAAEQLAKKGMGGGTSADFPRLPNDYRLVSVPFIDSTIALDARKSGGGINFNAAYSGALTGDLLGFEASGYFGVSRADPTPVARLTLSRHNPDGELLGPLHARSLEFGDISLPAVRYVQSSGGGGNGFLISNHANDQGGSYGLQTLRGILPPGWDVSLYLNDALVDFQTSRPDGVYEFKDLSLVFGRTEFRLVFNGPLGQRRVEKRSFQLDQTLTPPGKLYYSIGGKREDDGTLRQVSQFDFGLTRNVAITSSYVLIRKPNTSVDGNYISGGARASLGGALLSLDYTNDLAGGSLFQADVKTSIAKMAVGASRTWFNGFADAMTSSTGSALRYQDRISVSGQIGLTADLRLPLAIDVNREVLENGKNVLNIQQRLSANVFNTNLTNSIGWSRQSGGDTMEGSLQASHRVAGLGVSSQIAYQLVPKSRIVSSAVNIDKMLSDYDRINIGFVKNFLAKSSTLTGSINHRFGNFAVGLSGSYNNPKNFGVGLTLFTAIGRNPLNKRVMRDWQPMANTGMLAARVFIDANGNDRFDSGEEPVSGASFIVNGSGRSEAKTGDDGIALINRLAPHTYANVTVDASTLEDVQLQPAKIAVQVLTRPGAPRGVDFPVVLTGEIDGTVRLKDEAGLRGIGNVTLELMDKFGIKVQTLRSASDGYFVITNVKPGQYNLSISSEQLKKLDLQSDRIANITMNSKGDFVSGIDFIIQKLKK